MNLSSINFANTYKMVSIILCRILYDYIIFEIFYSFLERGREREREGKKHVVASCVPPTGNLAHNPDMCPN